MPQHSQHTNQSRHSNEDITITSIRVSIDDNSITKEKYDLEIQAPVAEISEQNPDDEHPDGGLTAWLVIFGVRFFSLS